MLRQRVVSLARASDPDLAEWIDANCSFPNSMVDCIVPATGPKELALAREFGIDDAAPVTHENFRQWVIEDDFCAGRPDWDRVGATFSEQDPRLRGDEDPQALVGRLRSNLAGLRDCIADTATQRMSGLKPYFSAVLGAGMSVHASKAA